MTTGWFGIPGKVPPVDTKVHVLHGDRTLCGWKPRPPYQFQWCAQGIDLSMIECVHCLNRAKTFLAIQTLVNVSGRAYRGNQRIL